MADVRIISGGLERADVRAILAEHLDEMVATSPPESVHALDLDALRGPGVSFWTVLHADGAAIAVSAAIHTANSPLIAAINSRERARGR